VKRCKGGEKVVLLDIGAGAGFPGIPIKVVLPDVKLVLVERSARKSGFLRHAVAHLNIGDTAIVHGEFPQCVRGVQADVITARAVERPGRVVNQIMAVLPAATPVAWFLCQSPAGAARLSAMGFHVEQIEDEWSRACLRRGQLYVVTHGREKG
jgi:16S rRNA G527 N7-methylase RsmG